MGVRGELHRLAHAAARHVLSPLRRVVHRADQSPGLGAVLLAVLVLAAVRTARGDRGWALLLVALSLVWPLFNGPYEGPTLVRLSASHGITVADLISVAGVALAAWRLAPTVRGLLDRLPR
jgi:hypothetical protein